MPLRVVLAAVVAVGAGVVSAGVVDRAESARTAFGELRVVPVAVREIPAGAVIGSDDIEMAERPVIAVPGDAAVDPFGRVVRSSLVAGEVVVEGRLAGPGHGPAALLGRGERALAIPVDQLGLELVVGDRVDVLAPEAGGVGGTRRMARAATVLAVGESSVTLGVAVTEAPEVARAALDGAVALALVGPAP